MKNRLASVAISASLFAFGLLALAFSGCKTTQIADRDKTDHIAARFRATVISIEPIASYSGETTVVAIDPRFILTLELDEPNESLGLERGDTVRYAAHSPSMLLGEAEPVGRSYVFALSRTADDTDTRHRLIRE